MDTELIISIIKYLAAVLAGVLLGNGAVYLFNHMPAEWFCDYGSEPSEEMKDPYTQRVKSTPWKYYFSMFFVAVGLYLVRDDWAYAVAALLIIWILLELSISDIKYRIVPDQLLALLAVSAVGTIQYHRGWQDMLLGAVLGLGITGMSALIGKAAYRRETVGGGDIKLFAALGLVLGVRGVVIVFMLSALMSGAHMVYLLARRKIGRKDTIPMVPYISAAAFIYLVFIWQGPAGAYLDTLII
ncbi:MAG: prepilin peptidase [Eubacterium sp.]|nr:prepilin peptidase [Eubacterium sp.]